MQDHHNGHEADIRARANYVAPQLTTYGLIKDLTAGGSGFKGEFKPQQTTRHP